MPARQPEKRLLLALTLSAPSVTVVILKTPPSGSEAELRPSSTDNCKAKFIVDEFTQIIMAYDLEEDNISRGWGICPPP